MNQEIDRNSTEPIVPTPAQLIKKPKFEWGHFGLISIVNFLSVLCVVYLGGSEGFMTYESIVVIDFIFLELIFVLSFVVLNFIKKDYKLVFLPLVPVFILLIGLAEIVDVYFLISIFLIFIVTLPDAITGLRKINQSLVRFTDEYIIKKVKLIVFVIFLIIFIFEVVPRVIDYIKEEIEWNLYDKINITRVIPTDFLPGYEVNYGHEKDAVLTPKLSKIREDSNIYIYIETHNDDYQRIVDGANYNISRNTFNNIDIYFDYTQGEAGYGIAGCSVYMKIGRFFIVIRSEPEPNLAYTAENRSAIEGKLFEVAKKIIENKVYLESL